MRAAIAGIALAMASGCYEEIDDEFVFPTGGPPFTVQRDNPPIQLRVPTESVEFLDPVAGVQRRNGPSVFVDAKGAEFSSDPRTAFRSSRSYLWYDPEGAPNVGGRATSRGWTTPLLLEPGIPAILTTGIIQGRRRRNLDDFPGSIPPHLGFLTTRWHEQEVTLDPNVLLLPVYLHVFEDGQESSSFTRDRETARRILLHALDGGPTVWARPLLTDSPYESHVRTNAFPEPTDYRFIGPDDVFDACGIQFRAMDIEFIPQESNLENVSFTFEEWCAGTAFRPAACSEDTRIGQFLWDDARRTQPGLHVYISGDFYPGSRSCTSDGGGIGIDQTWGVACATRCAAGDPSTNWAILDGRASAIERPATLAHEIGHLLGLRHTNRGSGTCGEVTDVDPSDSTNLMRDGGPSTTLGADEITLSPDQCAFARSIAQQYLDRWGG